jgi:hypothetical protein
MEEEKSAALSLKVLTVMDYRQVVVLQLGTGRETNRT